MAAQQRQGLIVLSLLVLLLLHPAAGQSNQATPLLSLRTAASSNWGAATQALNGSAWEGLSPCGGDGAGGAPPWKGVTCNNQGQVTELALPGLGLQGTLPYALAALPSLQRLDLSANAFAGSIPASWLATYGFPNLTHIDLGSNKLTGDLPVDLPALASTRISIAYNDIASTSLPAAWASPSLQILNISFNSLAGLLPSTWATQLPQLEVLGLSGNRVRDYITLPWYAGFTTGAAVQLRPGNSEVCGAVAPLNAQLYGQNETQISTANRLRTEGTTSTVIFTQAGLFRPDTTITLNNFLSTCILACADEGLPASVRVGGLPWPPTITTNLYDLTWQYDLVPSDLVKNNPGAAQLPPGSNLTNPPCYNPGNSVNVEYFGSDVAFGMFAGGNQVEGEEGLAGAMAAARVVGYLPNQPDFSSSYTGSLAPGGAGVVEPVYWFVDLLTDQLQITNVVLTAGGAMRNASVYVGSDVSDVLKNTLVASGLDLEPRQQLAVPGGGQQGRYVFVYTGELGEGQMNLTDVQVYTYETNAAAFKNVSLRYAEYSNGTNASVVDAPLQALVDNDFSSCVRLQVANTTAPGGIAWLAVDLGYTATVGSVAVGTGASASQGAGLQVYVLQSPDEPLVNAAACTPPGETLPLRPNSWAVTACNATGRYVAVSTVANVSGIVCEVQVGLTAPPPPPSPSDEGSGGLSAGAIVGIVVAGLAVLALLCLTLMYVRWRRRYVRRLAAVERKRLEAERQTAEWLREGGGDLEDGHGHLAGSGSSKVQVSQEVTAASVSFSVPAAAGSGAEAGSAGIVAESLSDGPSGQQPSPTVSGRAPSVSGAVSGRGGRARSQTGMRELTLMEEFFKSFTRSKKESTGSRGSHEDIEIPFGRASGRSWDLQRVTTDVSKLPNNFASVLPSDIHLVENVGAGSYGEVWLAKFCETSVAVKILAKVKMQDMTNSQQAALLMNNLRTEAVLMSKLRHPHVCLYFGACTDPPCLVMEYCANKSLDVVLKTAASHPQGELAKKLTWELLLSMALDAAKGMLYLHTRVPPVLHRDLKSANLLLDSNFRAKVADFNLSRTVESNSTASTIVMTNPRWLAPEVLSGKPGQLSADVWAFGTVLWELLSWELPFTNTNFFQIITMVQSTTSDPLVVPPLDKLPAGPFTGYTKFVELMRACRSRDPEARPKFDYIVSQLSAMLEEEQRQRHTSASGSSQPSATPTRSLTIGNQGQAAGAYAAMLRQRQASLAEQRGSAGSPSPFAGRGVRPSPYAGRGGGPSLGSSGPSLSSSGPSGPGPSLGGSGSSLGGSSGPSGLGPSLVGGVPSSRIGEPSSSFAGPVLSGVLGEGRSSSAGPGSQ